MAVTSRDKTISQRILEAVVTALLVAATLGIVSLKGQIDVHAERLDSYKEDLIEIRDAQHKQRDVIARIDKTLVEIKTILTRRD